MSDRYTFRPLGPAARPNGRPDHAEILPFLLIGEYPIPDDAAWLKADLGVGAVICLQDDGDLASKQLRLSELRSGYAAHDIDFRYTPVTDGDTDGLAAALEHIVALLRELIHAGKRVYVHCSAGMNRAPTVAIAYLHVHEGMSLDQAFDFVKRRRLCVPYMSALKAAYLGGE
jgi:protein-tyrosine phosphatase